MEKMRRRSFSKEYNAALEIAGLPLEVRQSLGGAPARISLPRTGLDGKECGFGGSADQLASPTGVEPVFPA